MRDRFSFLEFAIVVGAAFGTSVIGSIGDLLSGKTVGAPGARDAFNAASTEAVIVYELFIAPTLAVVLYAGGWRLKDFRLGPSVAATLMGTVIVAGMWAADWLLAGMLKLAFPSLQSTMELLQNYKPENPPGVLAIALLSIVNPVFEEVFVCAYVINALSARFGTTAALNISVAIRASYHLYQGVAMLPWHCAYGLMQAHAYVRYGRLWPLLVSHAVLDFAAMMVLAS